MRRCEVRPGVLLGRQRRNPGDCQQQSGDLRKAQPRPGHGRHLGGEVEQGEQDQADVEVGEHEEQECEAEGRRDREAGIDAGDNAERGRGGAEGGRKPPSVQVRQRRHAGNSRSRAPLRGRERGGYARPAGPLDQGASATEHLERPSAPTAAARLPFHPLAGLGAPTVAEASPAAGGPRSSDSRTALASGSRPQRSRPA